MMGIEFTGQIPFETVYLHGLIRDEKGRKMSKTLNNVIDPLIVMDKMGTDALRFTLLVGSTPGKDSNLSLKKVEANRNFANKVWNAGRLVIRSIPTSPGKPAGEPDWTLADSWIWARLQELVRSVDRLFSNHQYGEAGRQIYDYFWNEYADWYLEIAKTQIQEGGDRAFYTTYTMVRVLDLCLRLLHPFTPFVTEELWQRLKLAAETHTEEFEPRGGWSEALIIAPFPGPRQPEGWEKSRIARFNLLQEIVRVIRNMRAEKNIPHRQRIPVTFVAGEYLETIQELTATIAALAGLDEDKIRILTNPDDQTDGNIPLVAGPIEILVPLSSLVDPSVEIERLKKVLVETEEQIVRTRKPVGQSLFKESPRSDRKCRKDKTGWFSRDCRKNPATNRNDEFGLRPTDLNQKLILLLPGNWKALVEYVP